MSERLSEQYDAMNEIGNRELFSLEVPKLIAEIDLTSRELLSRCTTKELRSLIPNKEYFVFKNGDKLSRPINKALFDLELPKLHSKHYQDNNLATLSKDEVASLFYTLAMSFCAAIDTLYPGNKKTSATFFEKFIGAIFARELHVQPTNALEMLNDESLATDYIYKTLKGSADIHLQVKVDLP